MTHKVESTHPGAAVEGDTFPTLRITCVQDDGTTPIDLTTFPTRELIWKTKAGALITKAMTLVGAASAGVLEYQWGVGELEYPKMRVAVKLTDTGGLILTSLGFVEFPVRKRLT